MTDAPPTEALALVESKTDEARAVSIATIGAEMENFDPVRLRDRGIIGDAIAARGISGYIIAEGEVYQGWLEKVAKQMITDATNPKNTVNQRVAAAKALKDMANTAANWADKQYKAAGVFAAGKQSTDKQANAPLTINGTMIQANSVQVNGATTPAAKPVEAVEV